MNIPPYNHTRIEPSFNWLAVLKDLKAGMKLDPVNQSNLLNRASSWCHCACAQICPEFTNQRGPKDGLLAAFGLDFYEAVRDEEWSQAIKQFHLIQERKTELTTKPYQSKLISQYLNP